MSGCGLLYCNYHRESNGSADEIFPLAVVLVIVGTYFLFTAGSIAILKMLRKNKKFYYNKKHFTAVSGMLYRMKQNAAGFGKHLCVVYHGAGDDLHDGQYVCRCG